jgi:hypothetical protein
MENKIEVGQRFGKLVVITPTLKSRNGAEYCFVDCDCGKRGKQVKVDLLVSGKATHCGCETVKKSPAECVKKEPLHAVWSDMIQRCENPKRPYYYLYGGRGVKVCTEWRNPNGGYNSFKTWALANGYKFEPMEKKNTTKRIRNKYTLDRIDVNGDYCPENCRWVDYKTQSETMRKNLVVEFRGEKNTCIYFIKKYNSTIPYFNYLIRQGMTEVEALDYIAR